ncbi:helix-turn-helix domain-containing protein [Rubrimonas cliftonensis]|uniref:HTH DNA binding domain-containing protein n=1 Tax=Rubrimonas cliftonensis TaxID=89524 RepID=A0A1H4CWD1_9RHOB|nr:helix-turn-helix domain-containing protein [Rubrimonas cliftonensis]SEA64664.1 HTH DNA binding domain-containing protein [Rubrimonas cliftonensis]
MHRHPPWTDADPDDEASLARSIYDDLEEDAPPALRAAEDDAPRRFRAQAADAHGWAEAERACVQGLVAAAAGFARLDERLRLAPPAARRAARERLAVVQAARLLQAEAAPVDPWAMALDAARRRGRAGDEAPAMTLAHGLARRLAAARSAQDRWPAEPPETAQGRHCFVRAAALEQALRRADPDAAADAAVAAMRLAAGASSPGVFWGRASPGGGPGRGDARGGGARFAPLPLRRRAAGPEPEARLAAFLADLADGAADARAALDDLAAWRARADAAAAAMKGRTPARLVELLARRLALAAPEAARALGLSESAAGRALERLEAAGIAREMTGRGRFRTWRAAA